MIDMLNKNSKRGSFMNKQLIPILVLGLMACGKPADDSPDAIRKEIQKTRGEIEKLQKRARNLEQKLGRLNPQDEKTVLLVKVKRLGFESFEHSFQANGSIEAVREAFVGAEVSGRIQIIHVEEGNRVQKGELLVTLNSSIIENTLAEVRTSLKLTRTIFEKRKRLWEKKIGSEIEYLQAKNNKDALEDREKALVAQMEMTRIKAPISGLVENITVKKGAMALPGYNLLHIVDLEQVYINADISETYLGSVKTGDPVDITFPAQPQIKLKTKIHRIGNVVNPENRTIEIQMKMKNQNKLLKPNNLAIIRLRDFYSSRALLVPSILIKKDLKGEYIYTAVKEDNQWLAKKTYITPGLSEGNVTMIKSGLSTGQTVIVQGYNLVKNNTPIKFEEEKS
jgi:membrane fusion protein (multidrug efflux system)